MQIREVMSVGAEVVNSRASAIEAARKMRQFDIGSLPVCDGDRLQGFVTDRDLVIRLVAAGLDASKTPVNEIMTPDASYCFEDQTLDEAVVLMEAHQIRRLPILNREKRLVGMLSLGDIAVRARGSEDGDLAEEALQEISEPSEPRR